VGEWREIESAPKDGTEVLVCGGTYDACGHTDLPLSRPVIAFWDSTHWHGPEENAHDEWRHCEPTHWMPLPEPPTAPKLPCSSGPETELNLGADARGE
jgi:hypothetical protein